MRIEWENHPRKYDNMMDFSVDFFIAMLDGGYLWPQRKVPGSACGNLKII
jgi:hypothetical protein